MIKKTFTPAGLVISFLGPDGSGKSTIIDELLDNQLPFLRHDYFHLKPIIKKPSSAANKVVDDPHKFPVYSKFKSIIKILYYIGLYNTGWLLNVLPLKRKSSLVIFDRYYDDMLVDYRRYRYGGSIALARIVRSIIPRPDIYFILVADPKVIYKRKQEVTFEELQRQLKEYKNLADNERYFLINVDRQPKEISAEVLSIIMEKLSERN
jgi:thymidylate kinase